MFSPNAIVSARSPRPVPVPHAWAIGTVLGFVFLGAGCQSDAPPSTAVSRTTTLTAAETTLVVGDVEFYFPENAVEHETTITLRVAGPASVLLPVGRGRAANMVEVLPYDLTLLRPIQIRSPTPAISGDDIAAHAATPSARLLQAHHLPSDNAAGWLDIEADFQQGAVRMKSTKAGRFTVSVPVEGCPPVDGCFTGISQRHCEPEEVLDFGCDTFPQQCGDNEVIAIDDDGCPVCVPVLSELVTCDETKAEMQMFFERVIDRTCSNPCDSDGDCAAFRMEGACGNGCYSFNAYVDDEPMHAFIAFAQQRCGVCGTNEPHVKQVGYGACIDSQCHFPQAFAELEGRIRF